MKTKETYETFPSFIPDNKVYRWSSSISRGGYVFLLATKDRQSTISQEVETYLRKALEEVCIKLNLIDTTIKIFPTYFVIFTVLRRTQNPQQVIEIFLTAADTFNIEWDVQYLWNTIEDVGTDYIEKWLKSMDGDDENKEDIVI